MEQIEVITQDSHLTIAAEPQQSEKVKKSKGKDGNLNNSAAIYYSEMLVIQKKLALQKTELLKEKIKNEKLKQKILNEQLQKVKEKDLVLSEDDNNTSDDCNDNVINFRAITNYTISARHHNVLVPHEQRCR